MVDITFFKVEHLYNIKRLKELDNQLFENFLNNIVELCKHIFSEKKLVYPHSVLPGGNIYRIGELPIQFNGKYWPVGFGKDDENELIFNSTILSDNYAKHKPIGCKIFKMCRQFLHSNQSILLLNFKKQGELDKELVRLINKCIIIPIIYLNYASEKSGNTKKSGDAEEDDFDDFEEDMDDAETCILEASN